MHNALAFAHLFIGESGTMASESAVLGTPAIFINSKHFGCIDNQASYGLLFTYTESEKDQIQAIEKAEEIATNINAKQELIAKRNNLLADKIDVTEFLVWFVENYPESVKEVKAKDFDFGRFK